MRSDNLVIHVHGMSCIVHSLRCYLQVRAYAHQAVQDSLSKQQLKHDEAAALVDSADK